jgi:hypothetical protein
VTENCLEIEIVLKFESSEACEGKEATFGWLGEPKKSPEFKFSVSGKKNVCLFGVITKTSVLSDKNVPLLKSPSFGKSYSTRNILTRFVQKSPSFGKSYSS